MISSSRCTFHGSKKAGAKLQAMLAAGQSKPWPERLFAMTGSRQMDPAAMLEYFAARYASPFTRL